MTDQDKQPTPLGQIVNSIVGATSPANSPTSSRAEAAEDICPTCGGLGVIAYDVPVDDPLFSKTYPCPTCRHERIDRERRDVLRRINNLGVYADKTLASFETDTGSLSAVQRESLIYAQAAARDYADNPRNWLLLMGGYGCGKTHLAAAIANARIEAGQSTLFVTAPDLLDHLRAAFDPRSDTGYDQLFDRVRNTALLVLDDLGTESPTAWALEKLYQIINHRYNHRLPTVITTNVPLDALDARIASRLRDVDLTTIVRIEAPDYRNREALSGGIDDPYDLRLYADLTFDSWDSRGELPKADRDNLKRAADLAKQCAAAPMEFGWLVLTGTFGSGKTHLASAIANYNSARGERVLVVTVPDFLDYLRASFGADSNISFDRRFRDIREARLLVLDDLGVENASPWAREKLFQLIDFRYRAKLPTIFTMSKTLDEIDERIASRMGDTSLSTVFAITAPSYRGKKSTTRRRKE